MKKLWIGLTSLVLALSLSVTSIFASVDTALANTAYDAIVDHYENYSALDVESGFYLDEIIGIEALGLECENLYDIPTLYDADEYYTPGKLGKIIMAMALTGQDPRDAGGEDLVEKLESYVSETGIVDDYGYACYASDVAWVVFALEGVDSDKVKQAADYLASLQWTSGGFSWSYEAWGDATCDPDTTAWVIEALSNIGGYDATIASALSYLDSVYYTNGTQAYYDNYGPNPDSQANVIAALSVFDVEGLENGAYDKDGLNPLDTLANMQQVDGTFDNWGITYATAEAARGLGTYFNGSIVYKVQDAMDAFIEEIGDVSGDAPGDVTGNAPIQPGDTDYEKVVDGLGQDKPLSLSPDTQAPPTGDTTNFAMYAMLAFVSIVGIEEIVRRHAKN